MAGTITMSSNDPKQIREQYKTKDNLQVRIDTHQKYTEPKIDYVSSILDLIAWSGTETIIDIGCGAGVYVEGGIERGGRYIAGDLSMGMLQSLTTPNLRRVNLDAQHLPFVDESADVILANHMLYHVPDQDTAVSEIKRILRPGGILLAATNSNTNMAELTDLRVAIGQKFGLEVNSDLIRPTLSFTLEDGDQLLERHFSSITRIDQPSALIFPNAQPVVDYINSSRSYYESLIPDGYPWHEIEDMIHQTVSDHIAQHGTFRVSKLMGVFICTNENN